MKRIGNYTSDAKSIFKLSKNNPQKLHCQVDGEDIYISNSCVIFRMYRYDYDKIIFPLCKRKPGNWAIVHNGNECDSFNLKAEFKSCIDKCDSSNRLEKSRFAYFLENSDIANIYYSAKNDYSIFVNKKFIDALYLCGSHLCGGENEISPIVAYSYSGIPFAVILPMKPIDKRIEGIKDVVRSYFKKDEV